MTTGHGVKMKDVDLVDEFVSRKHVKKKNMDKTELKEYLEDELSFAKRMISLPNLDPICVPSWQKGIDKLEKQLRELKSTKIIKNQCVCRHYNVSHKEVFNSEDGEDYLKCTKCDCSDFVAMAAFD